MTAKQETQQAGETTALMTRKQAAAWLGITERALGQLNYLGTGPRFVVIGSRTVRYRPADLSAYVEQNLRTKTGDAA